MKARTIWLGLVFCVTALGVAIHNLPATWVAARLAQWSRERVILAESEGTFWSGSGVLVLMNGPGAGGRLPGRMRWRFAPRFSGLGFRIESDSPEAHGLLSGKLGWRQVHLDGGQYDFPAQVLTGLGAPFNTLRLAGPLKMRWDGFDWRYGASGPEALMSLALDAEGLSSRLSPVAPLGHYRVHLAWGPLGGKLDLETISGPLMLSGQGSLVSGRLGFDGQATASDAAEPQLIGLLSILGKRDGAVTRLHF
ncbi:MAG: type II secretion system protein N [Betaproteobacteria bacterium]|nr:type II secretion system protein N [Betaproteobacteria bacterium]